MSADDYQVAGSHYHSKRVQPWAAMQAWMSQEEFIGFLRGNCIKYLARSGSKDDDLQEYKKAAHYLAKLIETIEDSRRVSGVPYIPEDE
jgi:hypothetical protein